MTKQLDQIRTDLINSRPVYCHVLEVMDVYELDGIIEALVSEFIEQYGTPQILEFFNTITVICTTDDNETEVYDFDVMEAVREAISEYS